MSTAYDAAADYMNRVKKAREHPLDLPGIPYGFKSLDELTGGILENELTILAAETGTGKSMLLGQLSLNVAGWLRENREGKVVKVVHCEMPIWQVQERLTHLIAGVPTKKVRAGKTTDEEYKRIYQANNELSRYPIQYLEEPANIQEVMDFIRADNNCGWWAIDHIQDLEVGGNLSPLDMQAIGKKAKMCAALVKEVCSGMILSQYTNDVGKREDHRPSKADLFGGKMLQSPAAVIMHIYRPDMYLVQSPDKRGEPKTAHIIVDKNRNGGELGEVKLVFHPGKAVFLDVGVKVKE